MSHFTHLHLHTEYSLLDGAIPLDRLIDTGKNFGFKALAITDHGNIFGAVKFFDKCKKAGIKPILGMEAYITEDAAIKAIDKKYYHLILLVENAIGYKNLCKLISFSYQEGFYFKPRIDYRILEQHAQGLIATTACLGGHIPTLLMQDNVTEAEQRIDWFLKTFGPERFYFEIQPEEQPEQKKLNGLLYEWHTKKGVPLLATGDCHYVTPEDRQAHEVMLAIQTHHKLTDTDRFSFGNARVPIRSTEEMLALFSEHPEAVWNSGIIADRCSFAFETGKLFFPHVAIPEQHTAQSYFQLLCRQGLEKLIAAQRIPIEHVTTYQARLDEEIALITSMGFIGYFLVVSDFIQWARRRGIPVGPGRGSVAGSLVAWALEITNIDPIAYNLLFERFLNPERITMPDIDIDFCIEGREQVINYVREKYGNDKVCQIITFGTMMAKGVVKDVARVLGMPFDDSNMLTGMIPDQLKITLKEALEQEPRLKELIDANPKVAQVFDLAFRLEGLTRHASKHAAGIVISPYPIDEVLPVYVPSKTTELVTQFAMTELESLGFLKMDLLGLKNLTLIDQAVKLIEQNHGIHIDIDTLPLHDTKTFALIGAGKTSGVFQLESDGLKEVLRKLQPDKFEDIIAVNALYRPGPLGSGMVDDYIERRHGRQKVSYLLPELAPILQETYGVIVYQEQVMKIASAIAGYSLGEADILRRAMGKKKAEEMAKQRSIFVERATTRGLDATKVGELFDLMAYFAGYGFNKSHSAAYALIAYQTAYLKAHYPAQFMACLISLEATDAEKMVFYLQEAKDMGLGIIPPDINRSLINFSVVEEKLLFGLQGIKNVGRASLENILAERAQRPFSDLLDFCKRIDLRTSNKRVIEHLICAGAFDLLPGNRAQKCEELEKVIDRAVEHKKTATTGQMGLFNNASFSDESLSDLSPSDISLNGILPSGVPLSGVPLSDTVQQQKTGDAYAFEPRAPWDAKTTLEKEREVIGFYLSAHPLDTYSNQLRWLRVTPFDQLLKRAQQGNGTQEFIGLGCGLLKQSKIVFTKKGDRMAFLALEDAHTKADVVIFPKLFQKIEPWLDQYHVFVVKGVIDSSSQTVCKIRADELLPLDILVEQGPVNELILELPPVFDEQMITQLPQRFEDGRVPLSFTFQEQGRTLRLKTKRSVRPTTELLQTLDRLQIGIRLTI